MYRSVCAGALSDPAGFHMWSSVSRTFSWNRLARTEARSKHSASWSRLRRSMLIRSTGQQQNEAWQKETALNRRKCYSTTHKTHHRNRRGCSIVGRGIPVQWSKTPCHGLLRSKQPILTTAGPRGQTAGRYLTWAGGQTAGPGDYPGPDGTVWSPGCEPWSCPNLMWARPGSRFLKCKDTCSGWLWSTNCPCFYVVGGLQRWSRKIQQKKVSAFENIRNTYYQ